MAEDPFCDNIRKMVNDAPKPKSAIQKFCVSSAGISLISFFVFIILFMLIQPRWIFTKDGNGVETHKLNFPLIFFASALGAALVFVIPRLMITSK